MKSLLLTTILFFTFNSAQALADVFKYGSKDGRVYYTDDKKWCINYAAKHGTKCQIVKGLSTKKKTEPKHVENERHPAEVQRKAKLLEHDKTICDRNPDDCDIVTKKIKSTITLDPVKKSDFKRQHSIDHVLLEKQRAKQKAELPSFFQGLGLIAESMYLFFDRVIQFRSFGHDFSFSWDESFWATVTEGLTSKQKGRMLNAGSTEEALYLRNQSLREQEIMLKLSHLMASKQFVYSLVTLTLIISFPDYP